MADDREADLTTWDLPDETLEQAHACKVLRRFVAKWWAYNIEYRTEGPPLAADGWARQLRAQLSRH